MGSAGTKEPNRQRPGGGSHVLQWIAGGAGFAAGLYGTYVVSTWLRYGHATPPQGVEMDPLLDRFMPRYEVAERHHVPVDAPAGITLKAAAGCNLEASPLVRALFNSRAWLLGVAPKNVAAPTGLLARVASLGWRVLAEEPDREIVVGAVTRPWEADVVFRPIPPDEFLAFDEPGYVKIAWTLRVDPTGPAACVFRTETRVTTTDERARERFRWYWARFSPGIVLIRLVMLPLVREEAARQYDEEQRGAAARSE
jgi:hypothetical protein